MRRSLFVALLVVLVGDASGLSSLLIQEPCAIAASESVPDSGCPAFCVRCTCACCAASIEQTSPCETAVAPVPPLPVAFASLLALPAGERADILHIPKTS